MAHADPVCVVPGTDLGAVISGGFAVDVPGTRRPCGRELCPPHAIGVVSGRALFELLLDHALFTGSRFVHALFSRAEHHNGPSWQAVRWAIPDHERFPRLPLG